MFKSIEKLKTLKTDLTSILFAMVCYKDHCDPVVFDKIDFTN